MSTTPPEPTDIAENEIVFRFETNQAVTAASFGTFLREVERIAKLKRNFGPDIDVRVADIGTGSVWAKLSIVEKAAVIGAATAIGSLGLDAGRFALEIYDRLQAPKGVLSECVAEMCLDDAVVRTEITTKTEYFRVERQEMPAVATVEVKRFNAANPASPGHYRDFLELNGEPLTLAGEPLYFERPLPSPEETRRQAKMDLKLTTRGDLRVMRSYVGTLYPGSHEREVELQALTGGKRYRIRLAPSESGEDLPFERQVVIRASLNEEKDEDGPDLVDGEAITPVSTS